MNKCIIWVLTLILFVSSIQAAENFKIIKMTDSEIVLDFVLSEYKMNDIEVNNVKYQRIECESDGFLTEEGKPALPFFNQTFGLPVNGTFQVSLLSSSNITQKNIYLLPTEKTVILNERDDEKKSIQSVFFQDVAFYQKNISYPDESLKKSDTAFIGNRYFSAINFYPFVYNPGKKELQIIERARIRIQIQGDTKALPKQSGLTSIADQFGETFFINDKFSKNWRKEKEPRVQNYTAPKSLTQVNELYIAVSQEGIYKVTYEELVDSLAYMTDSLNAQLSFNLDNIDPRFLELRDKNGPVPIHFIGENDGSFDAGDYFEFYGDVNKGETCYYDNYSSENIYVLGLKTGSYATRMAVENGGLQLSNPSPNLIVPDSYEQTIHFENQVFTDRLGNQITQGEGYNFNREDLLFWKSITAPDLNITQFELEYPRNVNTRYFEAKVSLFGSSYSDLSLPDHHAIVRVNSALINNKWWSKQKEQVFENASNQANSYLNNGINSLYIDLPGDTHSGNLEQIFLDYFEIKYWREYKTDKNEIKFNKPSNKGFGVYQFDLQNFNDENISVYKLGSSVFNNVTVSPLTDNQLPPYTVSFQDQITSDGIEYYAVSESNKKRVVSIRPNFPSDLKNPDNSASYIIITSRKFINDPGTLLFKTTWEGYGKTVKIVDIQDIYDEFGHSVPNPKPIKDFLKFAYNQWTTPQLSHVLLLGEGIFDKRAPKDIKTYDIIPVKNIWTYKHGATSSDNWYACIVGEDPVADINIGRINVFQASQILPIAQKTVNYMSQPNYQDKWHSQIVLATGGKVDDATDTFAIQSEQIRRESIPEKYHVNRVYTAVKTQSEEYLGGTFKLKDYINDGTLFVQFMGHGGGRIWADYNLLNVSDIRTLSNSNYPIISSLACFASAFDTKGIASIGEAFIAEPSKGAIGHIGFSGLGYLIQDLTFGKCFSEGLFKANLNTIGDVTAYTKAKFFASYPYSYPGMALTQGCAYLGDPMVQIIKPEENGQITFLNDSNVQTEGDTLRFSVQFDPSVYSTRMYLLNNNEIPQNISSIEYPVINGVFNSEMVIPHYTGTGFSRTIKFIGSTPDKEVINSRKFLMGQAMASEVKIIPQQPSMQDSVDIRVKFFNSNINQVICFLYDQQSVLHRSKSENDNGSEVPDLEQVGKIYMHYEPVTGYWVLNKRIKNFHGLGDIYFYFELTMQDNSVQTTQNSPNKLTVYGSDLSISFVEPGVIDNLPCLRVLSQNTGSKPSFNTWLKVYKMINNNQEIIDSVSFASLESMEKRWDTVSLGSLKGNVLLKVIVNNNMEDFSEGSVLNNSIYYTGSFNLYNVDATGMTMLSLDNNVKVDIPAQMFNVPTYLNLVEANEGIIDNQPDIEKVKLMNQRISPWYELKCLSEGIMADSTGLFPNNKKAIITFYYSATDSLTQSLETLNRFHIYRWIPEYSKMVYQGGILSAGNNYVTAEISREGIYTLLYNKDIVLPTIDINVEGQEFTEGGYISGKGVLSFLFHDANGIDLTDHGISLNLDGLPVDPRFFALSVIPGHLNHLPMKYRIDLPKGDYIITAACTDVNGNYNTKQVSFKVNDQFDLTKVANYPNPVKSKTIDPINSNRTRFTYTLTDDADNVKIKVYTVSGRLVNTFDNLPTSVGYHEYPRTVYGWDCRDKDGYLLANGIYFFKVIAKKGNKEIVKTCKMAILR